jgi:hypothetical protein
MTKQNQTFRGLLSKLILAVVAVAPAAAMAQNMTIYSNSLVNGWENYGYTEINYANTSPLYAGCQDSVSVTITNGYGGIQIYHAPMSSTPYSSISFWLNGGASGNQSLQVYGNEGTGPTAQSARYYLNSPTPEANTWVYYTVPLSALGVANVTNFSGFVIQDSAGKTEPTFYLDNIQLNSSAPPSSTALTVNVGQPIRTADPRWFGFNTPIWDNVLDTPQSIALLTNMGTQAIRLPGGSDSDDYHWLYNRQDNNDWTWETSVPSFIQVITNLNATAMTTLNYGTGTSNEAAAWVAYVNAATNSTQVIGVDANGFNWQTAGYWASIRAAAPLNNDDGKNFLRISHPAPLGWKYWEIGNEVYGASWETDSNTIPHDPYTYAMRASGYMALIRAVDPTVKIGVVVETGEDSYVNNEDHLVTNPVTGLTHYGWTPVLLATLKSIGSTPDFAIFHNYPENPGGETDAGLLTDSSQWAGDASDLRTQITDYMGASTGSNIELVCTENNSVSSNPGKQATSLVNGLYKMDSLAALMQTEFNGLFWWAFRNGVNDDGNDSSALYGWREYGDYGIVDSGFTNLYPTYYTTELMNDFMKPGDTVITATSGYSLLSTYAVQRQDGRVTVLTINKDPVNTLTGQLSISDYTPASSATVYSYGIPQDNAVEFGAGSPAVAQTSISVTGTNVTYAFAPYSATVMSFSPSQPTAAISQSANQFVFQAQGQPNVPYVIETTTNLATTPVIWTPVSTNSSSSGTINVTNSVNPSLPQQYWQVVWQP